MLGGNRGRGEIKRKRVDETPRRGALWCFLLLDLTPFYSCCSGFGPDAKNLSF